MKIVTVFGTRPEAIKMAPVVNALATSGDFNCRLCVTAQHRHMLDQVLGIFGLAPDYDLDIMRDGQTLGDITSAVLTGLDPVLADFEPDLVLVHGDTTTTFSAALAAFYRKIPVAHVEAGLRTGNLLSPWPEEANRKLTDAITRIHFAPTQRAANNLIAEGADRASVHITGNSVIDALLWMKRQIEENPAIDTEMRKRFPYLREGARLVLITGHRRESFGEGFDHICRAIAALAQAHPDSDFLYPVHLNPQVREPVNRLLAGLANVHLVQPQDYLPFIWLMDRSYLILTDSGGIQEEAPSLGKPVLVMRDTTERPEAIEAGTALLVGADFDRIVAGVSQLLADARDHAAMAATGNPYGDGKAAERIVSVLRQYAGAVACKLGDRVE